MISREEALQLIKSHVSQQNIVYHMLALEAVMGAIYDRLLPTMAPPKKNLFLYHYLPCNPWRLKSAYKIIIQNVKFGISYCPMLRKKTHR